MTETVEWSDIRNAGSGDNVDYLKLKSGNTYRIRPVLKPVKFFKYFHKDGNGKLRTALCANPDTCPVRDAHPDLKKPSLRYAIYVIDRSDNNVKIMEAPQTVFIPFRDRFEATGISPGSGKDGSDWQIRVEGSGLQTRYNAVYLDGSPLTAEEKQKIKDATGGNVNKLEEIYKVNDSDEIEEKLFGEWRGNNSSSESNKEPVAAAATSDGADDDDDEFNF